MFGYLQKIGKALMVPVAVLPAAAVLMGIGYWIDPVGWGSNSQLAAFLIKSGAAIIDSMPILFAVGVAFGLSRDKNGAAALTGLVAFLVLLQHYFQLMLLHNLQILQLKMFHLHLGK